jgi:hypothetical protein
MADQLIPSIRILGFRTTYHKRPGMTELQPREWVKYAPMHDPNAMTEEMIKYLIPPEDGLETDGGRDKTLKVGYMKHMWAQIEPSYKAWKEGTQVPLDGTPLASWAGVTPEQIDVLRVSGIRTVQNVANLTEGLINKIMLPGLRQLKQTAVEYLDSRAATAQAEEMADLKAKLEMLTQMMAEKQDAEAVEGTEEKVVKRGPGRPPKAKPEQEEAA